MSPDVARAIPELQRRGLLPPAAAPHLLRAARGDLVSVREELRLLLYLGVLLVTGGAGILVKQNLARIGPLAIAAALGLAAGAALVWVARRAPAFAWSAVPSPDLAFDYLLLLGVLLAAADLAFIEVRFTPLGEAWPWHLLIVALGAAAAAIRYDSRAVFSLALASFAAWRGVSAALVGRGLTGGLAGGISPAVRWNLVGCGLLFVLLGAGMARLGRKAHFEPVAVHLGWLLLLGGLASGMVSGRTGSGGWAMTLALLAVGAGLAAGAYRARRFPLFAYGVVAGYLALTRLIWFRALPEMAGCFWLSATSIGVIAGLVVAQRRLREPA